MICFLLTSVAVQKSWWIVLKVPFTNDNIAKLSRFYIFSLYFSCVSPNASFVELKKVTEVFTRMFHDPHSKVFAAFVDTFILLGDGAQLWPGRLVSHLPAPPAAQGRCGRARRSSSQDHQGSRRSQARISRWFKTLPRKTRRTLAQLRDGKSPFLLSYKNKIDPFTYPSPLCPLCKLQTHDTTHLFNCPLIPTNLKPMDLWLNPVGVAALLAAWESALPDSWGGWGELESSCLGLSRVDDDDDDSMFDYI